jgi:hypothetical protein
VGVSNVFGVLGVQGVPQELLRRCFSDPFHARRSYLPYRPSSTERQRSSLVGLRDARRRDTTIQIEKPRIAPMAPMAVPRRMLSGSIVAMVEILIFRAITRC